MAGRVAGSGIPAARGLWRHASRCMRSCAASTSAPESPPPPEPSSPLSPSSVDASEVAKFAALADRWWDRSGPYWGLHQLNHARCPFVGQAACAHFPGRDAQSLRPLAGLSVLEVGCGGGILSEALARMGADVTAVDAAEESISVARAHAESQRRREGGSECGWGALTYEATTAEALLDARFADGASDYDVVIASEVIEHVRCARDFAATLRRATRPGGLAVVSTLNRTPLSWALAVRFAESPWVGLAPRGAHDWRAFVTPEELATLMHPMDLKLASGMALDLASGRFALTTSPGSNAIVLDQGLSVNYIAAFTHPNPNAEK